jgi:hypothetical protein
MHNLNLTVPELAFIAGTRGALGAGVGLLLSQKLTDTQRRAAGSALLAVGLLTTIPAALAVFGGHRRRSSSESEPLTPSSENRMY